MKLENGRKVEMYEIIVNVDGEMTNFRHFLAKLSQYIEYNTVKIDLLF